MSSPRTTAERLDLAIDEVLLGSSPGLAAAGAGLPAADRPMVAVARMLHEALRGALVSPRFEARLGTRLAVGAASGPWVLRHPGRLIVTGAVGSAVGVGVTAFAVWRNTRRTGAHRLVGRRG
ncbi:MAG: hypothetical protein IT341_01740 [Chloroflexi bacterium]|nr:hypothetical protein [Chloroflexota bacterium]